jgi:elongation factor P
MTLELDNGLFQVVDFQHVKPGKGGAFVRTKLRNARTGPCSTARSTPASGSSRRSSTRRDMQFLYRDGDDYVFMDTAPTTSCTCPVRAGRRADYLVRSHDANLAMYQGEIVSVDIPASVELTVAETEPGIQGDRVSGARKPATLETGKVIQVPLFVNTGDRVRVDTRTGEYITRV